MMHESENFSFVGGEPCLDFINTRTGWRENVWADLLISFENLVLWESQAGLLSSEDACELRMIGALRKRKAGNILREAISFRDSAREAVEALIREESIPSNVLENINAFVKGAGASRRLEYNSGKLVVGWDAGSERLMGKLFWSLSESLTTVLTELPADRIKMCAGHACEWFFYDSSKNGRRRWCQMSVCGNRAKTQRFAEKK